MLSLICSAAALLVFVGGGRVVIIRWRAGIAARISRELDAVAEVDFRREAGGREARLAVAGTREAFENIRREISRLVARVRSESVVVSLESSSLSGKAMELSARTEQQATALEQTSAAIQEVAASVQGSATEIREVAQACREIESSATSGQTQMLAARERLRAIEVASQRVESLVLVIDGISRQTNLLALNAAVESARAGAAGRGFSVIASEIRSLAIRCAASASEVRNAIALSSSEVAKGVESSIESVKRMSEILAGIQDLSARAHVISNASRQQESSLRDVTEAVLQIDGATQQNAVLAEQMTFAAQVLGEKAASLAEATRHARLQQGTADEAYALVQSALEHVASIGLRLALDDFNDPSGRFVDRDLYVIVSDEGGIFHAFAARPDMIGKSMECMPGLDATKYIADALRAARTGGGWVDFQVRHPATGVITEKSSYVALLEPERLLVSCGFFKS
ncbi:hypothetical protein DF141_06580 [Burkholderia cenocepacia]|nr:hypothetical protein DF141_06580 [Burkholderia cenocepacia]